jgi:outer membrane protein assembly factor BamE (lipoprotein component of BamABCDE complex)
MSRSLSSLAVALLLLAGCTALRPPSVPTGASMAEVAAVLGRPKDVLAGPGGVTEWQYPTGPVGQNTYIVTFGPDQRVSAFKQALTFENFARIRPDMTHDEIRLMFGRPYTTVYYRNLAEEVWSYRYLIPVNDNRIFNVHFDARTGRVRTTSDQKDELFHPTFTPRGFFL